MRRRALDRVVRDNDLLISMMTHVTGNRIEQNASWSFEEHVTP